MPTENRFQKIQRRTKEIRAASAGNMSEEEATKLATAEADAGESQGLLQPHGYDMKTDPPPAEPEPLDADKLVEEQEKEDPDKWSKLLDKATKVTGIDDLAKDAYETEPAQAPEGEEGYDSDSLQQVGPFQEGNDFSMDETRERWAEEDKKEKKQKERNEKFNKEFDEHTETQEEYREETQSIIAEDDAAHEERRSHPSHPAHITEKDSVIIQELEELIHDQHEREKGVSQPQQTANESPVLQQYREEQAAKEAARQAGIDRGVVSRGIMDDPQMISTTRRVNAEVDAKNEALRREGFETNQETIPVIDLEGGGAIGGGMYDPRLTKTVNVYNEKGDVIRQIQKDIPGARKELAQRMAAEGKVRMRATKGGYVRAAADEPYSRSDIYMSESQADRAESTVKDRSKEKKRRKGLLARNKLFNRGFRDSKNPLSYGKDAASVRIAEIMADAEKAKADAEARIKADDTLNDHQKELALIKAQAEIDNKAAAALREHQSSEGDKDRDVTSSVLKDKKTDEEEVKERERRLDEIGGLESNLTSLENELLTVGTEGERIELRDKIKKLREQIADLRANLDKPDAAPESTEPAPDVVEGDGVPTVSVGQQWSDLESEHGELAVGYTNELIDMVNDNDGDETTNFLAGNNTDALNALVKKIRDFLRRGRITEKMLVQIGAIVFDSMDEEMKNSYDRLRRVRDGQDPRHSPGGMGDIPLANKHNHADDTVTFLEKFFKGELPSNLDVFVPQENPGPPQNHGGPTNFVPF